MMKDKKKFIFFVSDWYFQEEIEGIIDMPF